MGGLPRNQHRDGQIIRNLAKIEKVGIGQGGSGSVDLAVHMRDYLQFFAVCLTYTGRNKAALSDMLLYKIREWQPESRNAMVWLDSVTPSEYEELSRRVHCPLG